MGMKSRGVYETPGGTIMLEAHRAMESICLDRGEMHLKASLLRPAATLPAASTRRLARRRLAMAASASELLPLKCCLRAPRFDQGLRVASVHIVGHACQETASHDSGSYKPAASCATCS